MDFTVPPQTVEFVERVQAFIDECVVPVEADVTEHDIHSGRLEQEILPPLRDRAREGGVFGPQLPREYGGQDMGVTTLALVAERCGPHALASLALNTMAPDEATMHLLLKFGTEDQKKTWLEPLARGQTRSCFGMTEHDAGSDPRRISARAERVDGGWRINGRKVFTTGAQGAAFCVVMAVSDPDAPPGKGVSMFIVPAGADGFRIVRDMKTLGFPSMGGHPEVAFEDVVVGDEAVLGELGAGFEMAQARLEVGRLGHSMRWIGISQRALDMMAARSLQRETFGAPLASRQAIQWWLSDGAMMLYASRLMILNACWRIEQGLPARSQVAMIKTLVSEVLNDIVDNALQVHGGWGYTEDFPFAQWYRDARAARIFDGPNEVHRMSVARRLLEAVAAGGSAAELCGDVLSAAKASEGA
jgi:alkylation response protein AidB-like acyl-CoA dehydrogenase